MAADYNVGNPKELRAFAKSQIGAGLNIPLKGKVFISVMNKDKRFIVFVAKRLIDLGFEIVATVHDEVIAESETDRLEEGIHLLTKPQPWAKGLPLAVEGFVSRRYRK